MPEEIQIEVAATLHTLGRVGGRLLDAAAAGLGWYIQQAAMYFCSIIPNNTYIVDKFGEIPCFVEES